MPGAQDSAEQVKFLVSCIRNTSNGRPDFAAVAKELDIVTKAAAQKRYERMLKANGVNATKSPSKAADDETMPTPQSTPVKRKAAAPRTPGSAKKTKGRAGKTGKAGKAAKDVTEDELDDENAKEDVKKEEESESDLSDPPVSEDGEM